MSNIIIIQAIFRNPHNTHIQALTTKTEKKKNLKDSKERYMEGFGVGKEGRNDVIIL